MQRIVITGNGNYNFEVPIGRDFSFAASGTFASAVLTAQYNSGMIDSATQATGTYTANALAAGDTIELGGVVYTIVTALSEDTGDAVLYEVLVGATDSDSIDNLIAAINNDGGEGSLYATGTPPNAYATAAADAGDTLVATAIAYGLEGEAVTTSAVSVGLSGWQAATLGGAIPVGSMIDVYKPFATTALALSSAGEKFGINVGAHNEININVASSTPGSTNVVLVFNALTLQERGR
jgi:hypothetical protein